MTDQATGVPCFLCGEKLECEVDRRGKPYLSCFGCGVQLFIRRNGAVREFVNRYRGAYAVLGDPPATSAPEPPAPANPPAPEPDPAPAPAPTPLTPRPERRHGRLLIHGD